MGGTMVCHSEKYKGSDCGGIQFEDWDREKQAKKNENIDLSKTKDNYVIYPTMKEDGLWVSAVKRGSLNKKNCLNIVKKMNARIKELDLKKAPRKDAVKLVSVVVSTDHDYMMSLSPKEQQAYFNCVIVFFSKKVGADNIIGGTVHMDEYTPHMHLRIVPATKDGRLCAKELFNRYMLREMQSALPIFLREHGFDIKEPEHGSKRKHRNEEEQRLYAKEKKIDEREEVLCAKEKKVQENMEIVNNLYQQVRDYEEEILDTIQEKYEYVLSEKENTRARALYNDHRAEKRESLQNKIDRATESLNEAPTRSQGHNKGYDR